MEHWLIVRAEGPDRFTAQVLSIPEVKAEASTEAGAIEQVKASLAAWLGSAKIVSVQVGGNGTGNPWLDYLGRSANDPEFGEYLEELRRAREADEVL